MSTAKDFYRNLGDDLKRAIKGITPFRATADGEANGKVSIIRLGQTVADGESYARLGGFNIADGDELICFMVGGKPVVAKLLTAAPTSHGLSAPLDILSDSATAFRVRDSGGTVFVVDNVAGEIQIANANDLVMLTGVASGEKVRIDGATGAATFVSVNTPVIATLAQSGADAGSTTSTVTNSVAGDVVLTLPSGTWRVYAVGGVSLQHSAGGSARWALTIGGTEGTARTLAMSATVWANAVDDGEVAGLSGSVTIAVEYRSSTAGTTSARNPWLIAIAKRES